MRWMKVVCSVGVVVRSGGQHNISAAALSYTRLQFRVDSDAESIV